MSAMAQRRTAAAAAITMMFAVLQLVLFATNPVPAGAAEDNPGPAESVCPIPDAEGVVARVLNKGGYIYANLTADDADTGPFDISLAAGVYDVSLTSWDNHTGRTPDPSQTQEQYLSRVGSKDPKSGRLLRSMTYRMIKTS